LIRCDVILRSGVAPADRGVTRADARHVGRFFFVFSRDHVDRLSAVKKRRVVLMSAFSASRS